MFMINDVDGRCFFFFSFFAVGVVVVVGDFGVFGV